MKSRKARVTWQGEHFQLGGRSRSLSPPLGPLTEKSIASLIAEMESMRSPTRPRNLMKKATHSTTKIFTKRFANERNGDQRGEYTIRITRVQKVVTTSELRVPDPTIEENRDNDDTTEPQSTDDMYYDASPRTPI